MKEFRLTINCGNEAFDDTNVELVRLIREVANKVEKGDTYGKVMDTNGNTVGSWVHEDE